MATKAYKRNIKDRDTAVNHALYASSGAGTVVTSGIDLGAISFARAANRALSQIELVLDYPALTATMLPDTKTYTFSIEMATDSAFTTPTTLASVVVTGAGGVGAVAGELRANLASDAYRYVRAKAVSGANTTDASTKTMYFDVAI